MARSLRLAALLLTLTSTINCAALFNGKRNHVQVNTNPSGAVVLVDGIESGITPTKLKLDARKNHVVTLKHGNKTKSLTLDKKINAHWIVLDVFGGLIPVVIDAATGSWYSIEPKEINEQLL